MSQTHYAKLVANARESRNRYFFDTVDSITPLDSLAKTLDAINQHITVKPSILDNANNDYKSIASTLISTLHLPSESISIFPQGSAGNQTLIRTPDNSLFDIDAVCSVNFNNINTVDPVGFFNTIGKGLEGWDIEQKNRCWKINIKDQPYYIEFTPSVPLSLVSAELFMYTASERYKEKALAVVDTKTCKWKTSNPEGFTDWVADQSKRPLITSLIPKAGFEIYGMDSVEDVPDQAIPLSDTLRIAIRLFKRHRDMAVRRNLLDPDKKPISVIIVTLLTQCYEGLADQGATFNNPLELLLELAELIPHMYEVRDDKFWIANPTVEGENFAEKWNNDNSLKKSFDHWAELLQEDLQKLLAIQNEAHLSSALKKVFGCTGAETGTDNPNLPSGLTSTPSRKSRKVPATPGLA